MVIKVNYIEKQKIYEVTYQQLTNHQKMEQTSQVSLSESGTI